MIPYPAALKAIGGAHSGIAPANLLDVLDVNGNIYHWADRPITIAAATGVNIDLSTGLDASGVVLPANGNPDPNWNVDQAGGGTAPAQAVYPSSPDWFGGWIADDANSTYIARDASSGNQGAAPYTFSRTFDLTGLNLLGLSIVGMFAGDDSVELRVNGIPVATNAIAGNRAWTNFTVPPGSPMLSSGLNTISLVMTASDTIQDAVRLFASVVSVPVSYEPWIISVPQLTFHRSAVTDVGNFILQNLSGDTVSRDFEKIMRRSALEGAFFVYRCWQADAQAAWIEVHGKFSVDDVGVDTVTLKSSPAINPAEDDTPAEQYCETCQWRWSSAQCGATGVIECQYSYQTCQVPERILVVLNDFEKNYGEATANTATQVINRRRRI